MKNKMSGRLGGFTLIELLVVVLIIGILAAVALPQYQKVVEKSRGVQAVTFLSALHKSAQRYYMANGAWPQRFDDLDIDIPWTGNTQWMVDNTMTDTRSNGEWSVQLHNIPAESVFLVAIGRISGKYKGAGFELAGKLQDFNVNPGRKEDEFHCLEQTAKGILYTGAAGSYCHDIFKGTLIITVDGWHRVYSYPN